MERILDIANPAHRRAAAYATAHGEALFYAFGNFCALAARPELESLQAMNRLKGRPLDQVGSITTTPERAHLLFDWSGLDRYRIAAVMDDLLELGPIGFRGATSDIVPEHLTSNGTAQFISPGHMCPSNLLVGEILELIGQDLLYITSANQSSNSTGKIEAAHCEMREIQREFGERDDVVLIGHTNERAVRRRYPDHRPCSTSIISFGEETLTLERLGSLGVPHIRRIAEQHGFKLEIADSARTRVPARRPRVLGGQRQKLSLARR
jgi:hypothetical protein